MSDLILSKSYDRWKFTIEKERWLQKNKLSEEWLFDNLEWMIGDGTISSVEEQQIDIDEAILYKVHTQNGNNYYLAFEWVQKVIELVLIYEDHWQSYSLREKYGKLDFHWESYDYFKNEIERICFSHRDSNKNYTYVRTTIVGGNVDLWFFLKYNLPMFKVINDYSKIFDEMSKYHFQDNKAYDISLIDGMVKIAKMIKKQKNEEVIAFGVEREFYGKESFSYIDNDIKSIQVKLPNGHYAIYERNHPTGWLKTSESKPYTISDGVILDWKGDAFEDRKLAKTIVFDLKEAKRLFYRLKQNFLVE